MLTTNRIEFSIIIQKSRRLFQRFHKTTSFILKTKQKRNKFKFRPNILINISIASQMSFSFQSSIKAQQKI